MANERHVEMSGDQDSVYHMVARHAPNTIHARVAGREWLDVMSRSTRAGRTSAASSKSSPSPAQVQRTMRLVFYKVDSAWFSFASFVTRETCEDGLNQGRI